MFLTADGVLAAERVAQVNCVCCGSDRIQELFVKIHFPYQQCVDCGMIFVSPRPLPEFLAEYYRTSTSFNYFVNKTLGETRQARQEKIMRVRAERLCAHLTQASEQKSWRILEIGAGSGLFIKELQKTAPEGITLEVVGIEPSPAAVEQARQHGLTIHQASLEELDETTLGLFDAVISYEVIEHLFDPGVFAEKSRALLAPGAILYFTTPNVAGFEMRVLGPNAPAFCPTHLNLFSPITVSMFLRQHGFSAIQVNTPGELDVSILLNRREYWPETNVTPFLEVLSSLELDEQNSFQQLLQMLSASSHMAVLAIAPGAGNRA